MATNKIKGLTIEIGGDTTKLSKALEEVDKKTRDLSGELGQINKLLKFDPGNAELLAQKQKVLAEAVENTGEKLKTLKEAEKQVQEQFKRGEVSEAQVRELQREIIATEKKMASYEKAVKETAEAVERLGDESEDAADEIDEVGKSADEAEEKADDLGNTLENSTSAGFTAVIGLATAAVGAIVGCIEASEDYRKAMGKLETAYTATGKSTKTATKAYKDLQKIIGDTDQAAEAVSLLAELVDTEEELAHWTGDILPGVYAKFGNSLQPEALTEAANETAKAGQVTGALADALNWAAEEGETFGVALKEATEENEEWNEAVKEATTAEDYFNLALQECSSEQERQQLITETLTRIYSEAAEQYKETNKEIIEANEASEEWNSTVAELGEEMAPLLTDIKQFGVSLLQNAKEPLKDVANFISEKALPALTGIGTWVADHVPEITAALSALAAVYVTYKGAVLAAEIAQNGIKATILATEAAQKLLNIATAATPWGLVATAVAGVTVALIAYAASVEDSQQPVDILTDEEKELAEAADKAARAFEEQQKSTEEALAGISSQFGHTQSLADELRKLADASGQVKEKDQERVNFILNELNSALGTEYEMIGGVIQQYGTLKESIDNVIQSKLANALLEEAQADYVTAQQEKADALQNLMLKEKEYQAQQEAYSTYYEEYVDKKHDLQERMMKELAEGHDYEAGMIAAMLGTLEGQKNKELGFVQEKEEAYNQAATDYGNYANTIMNYEEAQTAALGGNYDRAVEILARKGEAVGSYSDKVDEATARAVDALFQEAIDAGIAAERTRTNFEKGVKGYTQEMVDEAERSYQDAMSAYANAYADAESVGEDLGEGLSDGMETKRFGLLSKAKSLVSGIIAAMREAADSNSPSKKTMSFGEDMGEGAEIGIENKTKDVARAAERQVGAVLDAYRAEEAEGQTTLRNLAETQATRQVSDRMTVANANNQMLAEILQAIKDGQVIALDGDKLVGGTAERMDSQLGQRRELVERGAL